MIRCIVTFIWRHLIQEIIYCVLFLRSSGAQLTNYMLYWNVEVKQYNRFPVSTSIVALTSSVVFIYVSDNGS